MMQYLNQPRPELDESTAAELLLNFERSYIAAKIATESIKKFGLFASEEQKDAAHLSSIKSSKP